MPSTGRRYTRIYLVDSGSCTRRDTRRCGASLSICRGGGSSPVRHSGVGVSFPNRILGLEYFGRIRYYPHPSNNRRLLLIDSSHEQRFERGSATLFLNGHIGTIVYSHDDLACCATTTSTNHRQRAERSQRFNSHPNPMSNSMNQSTIDQNDTTSENMEISEQELAQGEKLTQVF